MPYRRITKPAALLRFRLGHSFVMVGHRIQPSVLMATTFYVDQRQALLDLAMRYLQADKIDEAVVQLAWKNLHAEWRENYANKKHGYYPHYYVWTEGPPSPGELLADALGL